MQPTRHLPRKGFTLIEMIGVLAIIAVLTAALLPKIFTIIDDSRINATVTSIGTVRGAVTDFSAQYGLVPTSGTNSRIDDLLVTAGLMDQRFSTKLGDQTEAYAQTGATWSVSSAGVWSFSGGSTQAAQTRIVCLSTSTTAPSSAVGANFRLDGTNDLPSGSRVVAAIIQGLTLTQARAFSLSVDGATLSTTSGNTDNLGRVAYNLVSGEYDVYVYISHQ